MIQKLNDTDFDKIYNIMEESFPTDEYRTYQEQKELLSNPQYCIYVLPDFETKGIRAFIAVWNFDHFAYIEHFAVNPAYRNSGIGSSMLQEMIKLLSCMICLEVELPDNDICKRRIRFYERNGFFINDYRYIQPPISHGRNSLPLKIMTSGNTITEEKFNEIKTMLYKYVYKVS